MTISVVILTLNEEQTLPGALRSLEGLTDDILVFDSFSSDRTCDVARDSGAKVVQRAFEGYASQRNAALRESFSYPWILMLDADERVTKELWSEALAAVSCAEENVAMFRMRRMDFFMGRWLRRSSGYPTWFGRLARIGMVRVEREINEEFVPLGEVRYLKGHLHHFPFARGVSHWVDRHNRYSTMEAVKMCIEREQRGSGRRLFSTDPTVRRKALKSLAYRLPLRPALIFLYLYFFRLGILDGIPGFRYCALRSWYEFLIDLKAAEKRCVKEVHEA